MSGYQVLETLGNLQYYRSHHTGFALYTCIEEIGQDESSEHIASPSNIW